MNQKPVNQGSLEQLTLATFSPLLGTRFRLRHARQQRNRPAIDGCDPTPTAAVPELRTVPSRPGDSFAPHVQLAALRPFSLETVNL